MFHVSSNFYRQVSNNITSASAESKANEALTKIEFLKNEMERLYLINSALWNFIKKNHNLQDQQLFDMVLEIDAQDGRIDGKISPSGPKTCSQCNRTLPRTKPFCIYCGELHTKDVFER